MVEAKANEKMMDTARQILLRTTSRIPSLLGDGQNSLEEPEPFGPYINFNHSEALFAFHVHGDDFDALRAQLTSPIDDGEEWKNRPHYAWIDISSASLLDESGEERTA